MQIKQSPQPHWAHQEGFLLSQNYQARNTLNALSSTKAEWKIKCSSKTYFLGRKESF
jgi:hypothetical protein